MEVNVGIYVDNDGRTRFVRDGRIMRNRPMIIRLWRKYCYGRLYWRMNNSWRDWESDAVACVRQAPLRTWFFSLAAIVDEIENCMNTKSD